MLIAMDPERPGVRMGREGQIQGRDRARLGLGMWCLCLSGSAAPPRRMQKNCKE